MSTLLIHVDPKTEDDLRILSTRDGHDIAEVASRLLARAVRASRPRSVYDHNALKKAYAEFADEDHRLAESGGEERAALLESEDKA